MPAEKFFLLLSSRNTNISIFIFNYFIDIGTFIYHSKVDSGPSAKDRNWFKFSQQKKKAISHFLFRYFNLNHQKLLLSFSLQDKNYSGTTATYRKNNSFCASVMVAKSLSSFRLISWSISLYSLLGEASYSAGSKFPYQNSSNIFMANLLYYMVYHDFTA